MPHVIVSGEKGSLALGEFTRDNTRYLYVSKVNKPNENTIFYDIYKPDDINTPIHSGLEVTVTPNKIASSDLTLAPDAEGYIYAITNVTTLNRYNFLDWSSPITTTLSSDYDVLSLVGLTNNANFLYIWGPSAPTLVLTAHILP